MIKLKLVIISLAVLLVISSSTCQTKIPAANQGPCLNGSAPGTDLNGMFSAANQDGNWLVTRAFLTGNTSLRGVDESFSIQNQTSSGELHSIGIGTGNSFNQMRSQSASGAVTVTTQNNGIVNMVASNLAGVAFGSVQVSNASTVLQSGQNTANHIGLTFNGTNAQISFINLEVVAAANVAAADTAAGAAGILSGSLYAWDDGDGVHIMQKR